MLDLSAVISDVFAEMDLPLHVVLEDEEENLTGLERWGWWLSYLAKAFSRAKGLEASRSIVHLGIYSDVRQHATNYGNRFKRGESNPALENQAFRLIRRKEWYERRIKKEYDLHETWQEIIEDCTPKKHRDTLVRYFQYGEEIDQAEISAILTMMHSKLSALEIRIEKERDEKALLL